MSGTCDSNFNDVGLLVLCDAIQPATPPTGYTAYAGIDSSSFALNVQGPGVAGTVTAASSPFSTPSIDLANVPGGTGFGEQLSVGVTPGGPLDLSTGDFTVEGWFLQRSAASVILLGSNYNQHYNLGANAGQVNGVVEGVNIPANTAWSVGVWHFVMLVMQSNEFTVYVDGVALGAAQAVTRTAYSAEHQYMGGTQFGPSFNGLVSNWRITKGIARPNVVPTAPFPTVACPPYPAPTLTGAVVPPLTADLTWTSSGTSSDPDFSDVSLLLPFDTNLNDASTFDNVMTSTTGAALSTPSQFNTGFVTFNGGDYLTTPLTSGGPLDLSDATHSWTVEVWVQSTRPIFSAAIQFGNTTDSGLVLSSGEGGPPRVDYYQGGSTSVVSINGPESAATYNFDHWAVVNNNGVLDIYTNGMPSGFINPIVSGASPWTGLVNIGDPGSSWRGNMNNLRVTKGIARYTGAFTPPTAPFPLGGSPPPAYNLYRNGTLLANLSNTPTEVLTYDDTNPTGTVSASYTVAAAAANGDTDFSDVSLLLTFDGSFADSSSNNLTATPTGATIATSPVKFGTGSGFFNNALAQSQLFVPISTGGPLDFGGGDFTAECWINQESFGGATFGLFGSQQTSSGFQVKVDGSSGDVTAAQYVGSTLEQLTGTGAGGNLTANTWHAVAFQRAGDVYTLFVDGIAAETLTSTGGVDANSGQFSIGIVPLVGPNSVTGNIDEFRITKGIARYSGNYTPTTSAFPTYGGSGEDVSDLSNVYTANFTPPPNTVLVPDLYNLSESVAAATLEALGLVLGLVSYQADVLIIAGNVDAQGTAAGSRVNVGASVNITLSTGRAGLFVPYITGLTAAQGSAAITVLGLIVGTVSYKPSLTVPAGDIISQNPQGGTPVGYGTVVSYVLSSGPPVVLPAFDWNATVISQFANSPTLLQLCSNMAGYVDQTANFQAFFDFVWNVDTAQGFGLDIWGAIVDVSRLLQIPTAAVYVGFQDGSAGGTDPVPGGNYDVQPFGPGGQGTFYTAVAATEAYLLEDDPYRQLILTKALANIVNTTVPAFNQLLQNLFPGRGNPYVTTSGVMAMTFHFDFALTPVELAILQQSGAVPVPPGVSFTIVVP